jgi:hypothetical protein
MECGVIKVEHLFITDRPLSIFTTIESICFDHDGLSLLNLFNSHTIHYQIQPRYRYNAQNVYSTVHLQEAWPTFITVKQLFLESSFLLTKQNCWPVTEGKELY